MHAIETDGLTKRFGDILAVDDLDLRVPSEAVYGFVGPNGAGKSTTIGLFLDLLRPTSGRARVLGLDTRTEQLEIRRRVGVLPERCGLFDRLTGAEHLSFAIDAKGADESVDHLLGRVGLEGAGNRPTATYSTGMAQRLRLGFALVGAPDLLILDEPASGLDPGGLARLREIVRAERDRGAAVFFSSHSLAQVQAVCDRVGILVDGELRTDTPVDAFAAANARLYLNIANEPNALLARLGDHPAVEEIEPWEHGVMVGLADLGAKADVLAHAQETHAIRDFTVERGTLEAEYEHLVAGVS